MLQNENIINCIKIHLRLQTIQGTFPVTISSSLKLTSSTQASLKYELYKTKLYTIYVIVLWGQLIHGWNKTSQILSLQALLLAIGYLVCLFTKWTGFLQQRSLIELVNLFLNFESRFVKGKFQNFIKNDLTLFLKQEKLHVFL